MAVKCHQTTFLMKAFENQISFLTPYPIPHLSSHLPRNIIHKLHTNRCFESYCLCVDRIVQIDGTTPNNAGTCSASWKGYNPQDFEDQVECTCVALRRLGELCKRF